MCMHGDDIRLKLFLRDTGLLSRPQIELLQVQATQTQESFYMASSFTLTYQDLVGAVSQKK